MLDRILDTIESCNLNFLVGSGLSSPYLKTLGLIETLLTDLEKIELPDGEKKLIRCSLYKTYFDGVISRNCKILEEDPEAKPVLNGYLEFVNAIPSTPKNSSRFKLSKSFCHPTVRSKTRYRSGKGQSQPNSSEYRSTRGHGGCCKKLG